MVEIWSTIAEILFLGINKNFTRFQVHVYDPNSYKIISKKEWQHMIDKGYSEDLIRKEDKERVQKFDNFMDRATLTRNSLSSLAEKNIQIERLPELRIVLVGKVRSRSKLYS